jgi:AraC-like DNA-binding protein
MLAVVAEPCLELRPRTVGSLVSENGHAAPARPLLAQRYLSLRLLRLKAGEEWSHQSDSLAFLFVKAGTGRYISGSVTRDLAPGDVLVLGSGSKGALSLADGTEMISSCFSISVEQLFPLFASDEIWLLRSIADELKGAKLYSAATASAVECHKLLEEVPPHFNLDHRSHLLRVASVILAAEFRNARHQKSAYLGTDERLTQVLEKLSVDEILGLSVEELARRFNCSRRHLNRLFHQQFGLPVATLKMEMRMLKAVSLLRDPLAKVIYVAEQCGFNHLGLFNTCFKRRFGASPSQWRKQASEAGRRAGTAAHENPVERLLRDGLCQWQSKPAAGRSHPKMRREGIASGVGFSSAARV